MNAEELHTTDPAAQSLGISLGEASEGPDGQTSTHLTVTADMLNPFGTCHGGVIFQLIDTAMAYRSNAGGPTAVATSASIDFVAAAHEGDELTATLTSPFWARNAVHDGAVTKGDGTIVALFRGKTLRIG